MFLFCTILFSSEYANLFILLFVRDYMFIQQNKKFWFTLAETIIVCTVFAVMVIWIIFAINRAFVFMNNTRVAVIATNLAREGVEMVYNIRDTNRRKNSGERDKEWLQIDCTNGSCIYFGKGVALGTNTYYVLKEKSLNGDTYFYAEPILIPENENDKFYEIDWFFSDTYSGAREKTKLDFTWTYSYYSWWGMATWNLSDLLSVNWVEFYRLVRVYWVACKYGATCTINDSRPKEMRFCVKIFYEFNGWQHASELCSIMTNFME